MRINHDPVTLFDDAMNVASPFLQLTQAAYQAQKPKVFAVCEVCRKPFEKDPKTILKDRSLVCRGCAIRRGREGVNEDSAKQKRAATNLQRYGVANPLTDIEREYVPQTPEIRAKARATCKERYGAECVLSLPENVAQRSATKLERYGDKAFNNHQKAVLTNVERYGEENVFQVDEIKKKADATMIERYGVRRMMQSASYRSDLQQRFINTLGVSSPSKTPEVKGKISSTVYERYGVLWFPLSKRYRKLARAKYHYDGNRFDSSWELAYYVWAKDTGKSIRRNTDGIEYEWAGVHHHFFPDFVVGGRLVEVKSVWVKSMPWQYWEAKKVICAERNIEVIDDELIQQYLDYAISTYGPTFFKDCKTVKEI